MYLLAKIKDELNWLIKPERLLTIGGSLGLSDSEDKIIELIPYNDFGGKRLAFTFDDGPNPNTTPDILAVLKAYDVKAIFFLIGDNAGKHPEIVSAILQDGHEIGYHTMHHDIILLWSRAKLEQDFQKFVDVVGIKPKFARPPFALVNYNWVTFCSDNRLRTVLTNSYPRDKTIVSQQKLLNRMKYLTKDGTVFLLHDGDKRHVNRQMPTLLGALGEYLEYLRA